LARKLFPTEFWEVGTRLARNAFREYNCLVKIKTSITLPAELLVRLDRVDKNRSAVLERAALAYLSLLDQQARDRRDIAIIERNAKRLNREAQDTLEYQRTP
jgi:metal-responsive CopG/Arc/MetJ family transcriptional regulator